MFLEVAEIAVKPSSEPAFEQAVAEAAPLFLRAKGCHGLSLHRIVEDPTSYRLVVKWETVEDHMVHFRNSADFQEWRRLVGDYFREAPSVTHSHSVLTRPSV
ncbi:MAG: antibiotic biosynthesis monooxygenase [Mesorhizobium sp.]|uniref:antibiotic biosynthesis monooxygenase family protein n=1 Tax=Mesorhizobium sp. TaxID=1871066 RepID=UPI000FE9CF6D|nr:antibiotic biosynthesis monooxygenase family protein [Mesorhizobium sp.]RWD52267.1 MAG: antibiotic biosynthesis monooxygenase [Mesorhizobium sp.]RWE61961.1 MAG: antibiotic biosynthesis monooxygenase [Mesorhizobium sp.]RWF12128.1 MAG: antibiotic biosynthesis monooxygenase [Mesorhizobium sp.]RWF22417.1 MAG: antibiotic biosynthesis monooxygenase [Mesorhizobium sp.]TIY03398.1 MAG: antibiotic biosynthesis monooxygenase [Mesorhizobium sp.]